ncbi:hypothetical protein BCR42DRAFT_406073 [Absidia repens]|uniref:R3H domain-containing protein n=1 Tax=Absidia repens TaxID=90262 RepID=A0A1X2IVZ8_9FUNG|nr:hypothetical protein BCR42DRAFT_406073 [Absidia repens]
MTAATGTRVFFVESTAHWEALQRERAQFHHSSTPSLSSERSFTPSSRKQQHATKSTSKGDALASRFTLAAGKPGSRRRKRWDNNHLKDNPAAILFPEDLKPPGHQHSTSRILHFQGQLEDGVEDDTIAIDDIGDTDIENNYNDLSVTDLPSLTRQMRYGLKRQHIPEGWVSYYEQQLLEFLSQMRLQCQQQTKQHTSEQNDNTLIWEIEDSYLRWLVHAICRYHNVNSYSETTSDGRRITFAKFIDDQQLEQPHMSFLEYINK